MSHHLLVKSPVVQAQLRRDLPDFKVGSLVSVHYKIIEGDKERIQIFSGIVINKHSEKSLDASFTVLKVSVGAIKVSRVFPLHSPSIFKIEVTNYQRGKRANLTYLKDRKDPIKAFRSQKVKAKKAEVAETKVVQKADKNPVQEATIAA